MKTIQSINLWKDGTSRTASILKMFISYDDLNEHAVVQYQLLEESLVILATGSVTIAGQDYIDWGLTGDPNAEIYAYGANSLGLTITGNYVAPQEELQP
jgi:hypothetical protein